MLVDGAQSIPHIPIDVQKLGCDFFVFSGHKLYGPTGIGVLYGREELLEQMPPYQAGGEMIRSVTFEKTLYNVLPHKFEAGTPNIAGSIGLGAAIDYVDSLGMEQIAAYEKELLDYGTDCLSRIGGLKLIGTAREKGGILVLYPRRHSSPRHWDHPGLPGHCHPHRPPLRPTCHAAVRHSGHCPGIFGVL